MDTKRLNLVACLVCRKCGSNLVDQNGVFDQESAEIRCYGCGNIQLLRGFTVGRLHVSDEDIATVKKDVPTWPTDEELESAKRVFAPILHREIFQAVESAGPDGMPIEWVIKQAQAKYETTEWTLRCEIEELVAAGKLQFDPLKRLRLR